MQIVASQPTFCIVLAEARRARSLWPRNRGGVQPGARRHLTTCISDFDVDDPQLRPADMLATGTAANWLTMARHAISSPLP